MSATLTTPAGKVRSQSSRRFVLVRWRDGQEPRIVKRSDSLETLRTHRRRQGFESTVHFIIFDTTTGEPQS
jgi:hypothetical protein